MNINTIASEVHTYAYPLVVSGMTYKISTNVPEPNLKRIRAPWNQIAHADNFPDHTFKDIVRPNVDTLYSLGHLNLSDEPQILHIPAVTERYYMIQLMDAWTNVIISIGTRTTGTKEGDYLIAGPSWEGDVPSGITLVRSPTNNISIIGRFDTKKDKESIERLNKIRMEGMYLKPLSYLNKSYTPPKNTNIDPTVDMDTPTVVQVNNLSTEEFFNMFISLLKDNPPYDYDAPMLEKFKKLGIKLDGEFDINPLDPKVVDALDSAVKNGPKMILNEGLKFGKPLNNWLFFKDLGDYKDNYLLRALVAQLGWGANKIEDAIYPLVKKDSNGNFLNGETKYIIHFEANKLPPVRAFWSITVYQNLYLVKNPINRYALGDRDDIKYNADGSLDIYLQHEPPEDDKLNNWLPTPKGIFDMNLRMYWPKQEVIEQKYAPPPVKPVS